MAIIRGMTITIKNAADIEGMRIAGRLASEVLDMLTPHVKPGVTTEQLDKLAHDYIVERAGRDPGAAELRAARLHALPQVDLHLGQPPGLPRHPERPAAEERRHRQHRRHRHQGRLARRHQPHVHRRRTARSPPSACAQITYEAMWKGIVKVKPGAHLGDIGHAIQTFAESQRLLGGARVLRPRHRPQLPRGAAGAALRPARHARRAGAGHDVHHRADDQRRPARDPRDWATAGPSSPRTARCRRSGSTPCWSPTPATRC